MPTEFSNPLFLAVAVLIVLAIVLGCVLLSAGERKPVTGCALVLGRNMTAQFLRMGLNARPKRNLPIAKRGSKA